jgi:hypothetical protein
VVRAGINATSKLREFQVRMLGAEGEDASAGLTDGVQSIEPLGVAANPAAGTSLRTLMVQIGNQLVSLATWNKSKRPTDLAAGEIRFHGLDKVAAALRILATGKIHLDAESGQDIVVNGGTAKVARVGDSIKVTFPTGTFLTSAQSPVYNLAPVEFNGTITDGAPNFKA